MIYQRVLVPVSGKNSGERAAKALRHAKTLCSGEIILLHVTEALPNLVGGAAHTELNVPIPPRPRPCWRRWPKS